MISSYSLRLPKVVFGGENPMGQLANALRAEGVARTVVLTDASLRRLGIVDSTLSAIRTAGVSFEVIDDIPAEPSYEQVQSVVDRVRKAGADVIVAVGGGSVMMLAHHDFRVVHVSTHCSLREACNRVKKARVLEVIELANEACRNLGIERPRIAVAGLNPHCGEHGLFGTEEIDEISPAIEAAKGEGIDAVGPCPPDSVFSEMHGGWYDITVCMTHFNEPL